MDPDISFVLGCVIALLSIPAIVSAFADGRAPRAPAIIVVLGGLLIAYAVVEQPGAYTLAAVPDVFASVISKLIN